MKNLGDAKNKDALESRKMIIEEIQNSRFDTVHIMGDSLGVADHPFFKAINGDAMVYCYCHDEKGIIFMEDFLLSGGCQWCRL